MRVSLWPSRAVIWANTKSAVKLHTMLDLRGSIPTFIHISTGKMADVRVLDILPIEAGAFYVRRVLITSESTEGNPAQATLLRERARAGEKKATLAREFGISRETLYAYLRNGSAA